MIVDPKGNAFQIAFDRVQRLSFEPIEFPQHQEMKALFAEWEFDYAQAKMRDAQALFGVSPVRSSAANQPANDNEKDRGGRE